MTKGNREQAARLLDPDETHGFSDVILRRLLSNILLFNQVYIEAFETILFIEKIFRTELREYAIKISR